jgi:hypothetical protein
MLSPPIWILAIVVIVLAVILVKRRAFRRTGSRDERLAMTVWAAFGPYSSAEDAADALRRSVRAVFGPENYDSHAGRVQGHADNFRLWQSQGNFDKSQEFIRRPFLVFARGRDFEEACQKVRDEAQKLALEAMSRVNKDLEATGLRFEAVPRADGALDLSMADEVGQETRAARIANRVGHSLLTTSSDTGVRMREFLMALSRSSLGRDLENAEDIGRLWLSCYDQLSENPESETTLASEHSTTLGGKRPLHGEKHHMAPRRIRDRSPQ